MPFDFFFNIGQNTFGSNVGSTQIALVNYFSMDGLKYGGKAEAMVYGLSMDTPVSAKMLGQVAHLGGIGLGNRLESTIIVRGGVSLNWKDFLGDDQLWWLLARSAGRNSSLFARARAVWFRPAVVNQSFIGESYAMPFIGRLVWPVYWDSFVEFESQPLEGTLPAFPELLTMSQFIVNFKATMLTDFKQPFNLYMAIDVDNGNFSSENFTEDSVNLRHVKNQKNYWTQYLLFKQLEDRYRGFFGPMFSVVAELNQDLQLLAYGVDPATFELSWGSRVMLLKAWKSFNSIFLVGFHNFEWLLLKFLSPNKYGVGLSGFHNKLLSWQYRLFFNGDFFNYLTNFATEWLHFGMSSKMGRQALGGGLQYVLPNLPGYFDSRLGLFRGLEYLKLEDSFYARQLSIQIYGAYLMQFGLNFLIKGLTSVTFSKSFVKRSMLGVLNSQDQIRNIVSYSSDELWRNLRQETLDYPLRDRIIEELNFFRWARSGGFFNVVGSNCLLIDTLLPTKLDNFGETLLLEYCLPSFFQGIKNYIFAKKKTQSSLSKTLYEVSYTSLRKSNILFGTLSDPSSKFLVSKAGIYDDFYGFCYLLLGKGHWTTGFVLTLAWWGIVLGLLSFIVGLLVLEEDGYITFLGEYQFKSDFLNISGEGDTFEVSDIESFNAGGDLTTTLELIDFAWEDPTSEEWIDLGSERMVLGEGWDWEQYYNSNAVLECQWLLNADDQLAYSWEHILGGLFPDEFGSNEGYLDAVGWDGADDDVTGDHSWELQSRLSNYGDVYTWTEIFFLAYDLSSLEKETDRYNGKIGYHRVVDIGVKHEGVAFSIGSWDVSYDFNYFFGEQFDVLNYKLSSGALSGGGPLEQAQLTLNYYNLAGGRGGEESYADFYKRTIGLSVIEGATDLIEISGISYYLRTCLDYKVLGASDLRYEHFWVPYDTFWFRQAQAYYMKLNYLSEHLYDFTELNKESFGAPWSGLLSRRWSVFFRPIDFGSLNRKALSWRAWVRNIALESFTKNKPFSTYGADVSLLESFSNKRSRGLGLADVRGAIREWILISGNLAQKALWGGLMPLAGVYDPSRFLVNFKRFAVDSAMLYHVMFKLQSFVYLKTPKELPPRSPTLSYEQYSTLSFEDLLTLTRSWKGENSEPHYDMEDPDATLLYEMWPGQFKPLQRKRARRVYEDVVIFEPLIISPDPMLAFSGSSGLLAIEPRFTAGFDWEESSQQYYSKDENFPLELPDVEKTEFLPAVRWQEETVDPFLRSVVGTVQPWGSIRLAKHQGRELQHARKIGRRLGLRPPRSRNRLVGEPNTWNVYYHVTIPPIYSTILNYVRLNYNFEDEDERTEYVVSDLLLDKVNFDADHELDLSNSERVLSGLTSLGELLSLVVKSKDWTEPSERVVEDYAYSINPLGNLLGDGGLHNVHYPTLSTGPTFNPYVMDEENYSLTEGPLPSREWEYEKKIGFHKRSKMGVKERSLGQAISVYGSKWSEKSSVGMLSRRTLFERSFLGIFRSESFDVSSIVAVSDDVGWAQLHSILHYYSSLTPAVTALLSECYNLSSLAVPYPQFLEGGPLFWMRGNYPQRARYSGNYLIGAMSSRKIRRRAFKKFKTGRSLQMGATSKWQREVWKNLYMRGLRGRGFRRLRREISAEEAFGTYPRYERDNIPSLLPNYTIMGRLLAGATLTGSELPLNYNYWLSGFLDGTPLAGEIDYEGMSKISRRGKGHTGGLDRFEDFLEAHGEWGLGEEEDIDFDMTEDLTVSVDADLDFVGTYPEVLHGFLWGQSGRYQWSYGLPQPAGYADAVDSTFFGEDQLVFEEDDMDSIYYDVGNFSGYKGRILGKDEQFANAKLAHKLKTFGRDGFGIEDVRYKPLFPFQGKPSLETFGGDTIGFGIFFQRKKDFISEEFKLLKLNRLCLRSSRISGITMSAYEFNFYKRVLKPLRMLKGTKFGTEDLAIVSDYLFSQSKTMIFSPFFWDENPKLYSINYTTYVGGNLRGFTKNYFNETHGLFWTAQDFISYGYHLIETFFICLDLFEDSYDPGFLDFILDLWVDWQSSVQGVGGEYFFDLTPGVNIILGWFGGGNKISKISALTWRWIVYLKSELSLLCVLGLYHVRFFLFNVLLADRRRKSASVAAGSARYPKLVVSSRKLFRGFLSVTNKQLGRLWAIKKYESTPVGAFLNSNNLLNWENVINQSLTLDAGADFDYGLKSASFGLPSSVAYESVYFNKFLAYWVTKLDKLGIALPLKSYYKLGFNDEHLYDIGNKGVLCIQRLWWIKVAIGLGFRLIRVRAPKSLFKALEQLMKQLPVEGLVENSVNLIYSQFYWEAGVNALTIELLQEWGSFFRGSPYVLGQIFAKFLDWRVQLIITRDLRFRGRLARFFKYLEVSSEDLSISWEGVIFSGVTGGSKACYEVTHLDGHSSSPTLEALLRLYRAVYGRVINVGSLTFYSKLRLYFDIGLNIVFDWYIPQIQVRKNVVSNWVLLHLFGFKLPHLYYSIW